MSPKSYTLLIVALACALLATSLEAQGRKPIRLPEDPSAVVILLEVKDRTPYPWLQCQLQGPFLTVLADGSFRTIEPFCEASGFEGKLTAAELQDVLHFIIGEQQFFGLDPKGSYKPSRPDNLRIVTDHGRTTYVQIQTADRRHETTAYWGQVPGPVDEIKRVETRLRRLVAEKKAGKERLMQALAVVNQFLKREYPDVMPFTTEDLLEFHDALWGELVTSTRLTFQRDIRCDCEEATFSCNCDQVFVETSLGQPPLVRYDPGQRRPVNTETLLELYLRQLVQ